MELCDKCNKMTGYVVKDGGTIFCLECLHFINLKSTCKGFCQTRCLKCCKSADDLRTLADYIKKINVQ